MLFSIFKLDINIEPEKGWKTEDMFVPAGFHIDAEMTGEDEEPEGEPGEQPYVYPMGVGGVLMNGCYGTNYKPGDPCYDAYGTTTICAVSLIINLEFKTSRPIDSRPQYNNHVIALSLYKLIDQHLGDLTWISFLSALCGQWSHKHKCQNEWLCRERKFPPASLISYGF